MQLNVLEDDSTLAHYKVQNEELCRLRTWFEKVAAEPDKPVKITRSESTENASFRESTENASFREDSDGKNNRS